MKDEQEYYRLMAKMPGFQRKIDNAKKIVSEAMNIGNFTLSFSGGKDSVVMYDIVHGCGWHGTVLQTYYSPYESLPENSELAKYYAQKYGDKVKIIKAYSCMEAWDAVGHFYSVPQNEMEKKLKIRAETDFREKLYEEQIRLECVGTFIGLCADESKMRKMNLIKHGKLYRKKTTGSWVCTPVVFFSADEIWAYIFSHGLRYLRTYDCPVMDMRRIRSEPIWMCAHKAIFNGLLQGYRILYPEIVHEIEKRYGRIE